MITTITTETIQKLRQPFSPNLVKWKVQSNPKEGKDMALVVAFIDARDVAEQLDAATEGQWSDDYGQPVVSVQGSISVECCLTVCGISRKDVGTFALSERENNNEDAVKAAYSDSFKRAALKFGVNAAMYRFPTVYARAEQKGRSWSLTAESKRELATLTQALCAGENPPTLSSVWVVGQQQAPQAKVNRPSLRTDAPVVQQPAAPRPRPAQPAASDLQRQRIAREVNACRAAALAIDALGDQFGVANLSKARTYTALQAVPLTITQASTLISALAELGQRSARAA